MLGTLPGPLDSRTRFLGPDWLESAGEGWGRLDKASGPEQAWIGWQNTLAHTKHSGTLLDRNFVG